MNSGPAEPALQAAALSCVRGDRTLFRGVDVALDAGELLHVSGYNGSGKTTLLRALAGLFRPEAGEIRWQGRNIRRLREEYTRQLLYLGHLNGIKGDLTGVENLRIASILDGRTLDERRAWDVLDRIGLRGHEDLPCKHLSQGQKRRVALARLLVNDAPLWILDEPFTALDVDAVDLLQSVICAHLGDGGMAVITTHRSVDMIDADTRTLELGNARA